MKPSELYKKIQATTYTKSGDDVYWAIEINEQEQTIYLIFAPSNSKCDWVNNFSFPVKVYKRQQSKIRCAIGWRNTWKSCNDEIMSALLNYYTSKQYKDYKLIITGWSYGGAISLLAAEDWTWRTGYKPEVITFGAPKPFWGSKSRKYLLHVLGEVKEYCHKSDIVTYCPPFTGYKHVKKESIGKFNLFRLFNSYTWHCCYGDEDWYEAN